MIIQLCLQRYAKICKKQNFSQKYSDYGQLFCWFGKKLYFCRKFAE